MKRAVASLLLCLPLWTAAQNPIIHDQFTADPTARVFNGRVYLYPSHDIPAPEGARQNWFCMADYHVFSSDNLVDWTDHGVIVTQNKVPWVRPDSYSMWAPDCVCKDGRYYFYFPSAPREGRGFAVGVATADRPEGPFVCEEKPIEGVTGIDPCVLIDDDGQSYIYWAGGPMRGARLKGNMKELDGEAQMMEGLPEGFKEGPYVFKREGLYYLTFPWVRKENGTETLAYATSRNPLGPWTFRGIIMAESPIACWTNHHSIVEFRGQWYLFYHHNDYSPAFDKLRAARIDKLRFNADGTIREVVPTLRGVGVTRATDRIEVDRYSRLDKGCSIAFVDTLDTFRGWSVRLPKKGSSAEYDDVDFSMIQHGYLVARVRADANTGFSVRERNAKGRVMARVKVVYTGEGQFRRDCRGHWLTVTAPLTYVPKGVSGVCVVCEGETVDVDWIQLKQPEAYSRTVGSE